MQKRGLMLIFISAILGLFLINVTSASFHYGGFGLGNILDNIDPSTMILGLIFIIVLALLNYSLSKVFRDNRAVAGVISLALSLGIIWAVNRSGFNFEGLFYSIGFSEGVLATITPLILFAAMIFVVIKWKMRGLGIALTTIGAIFIILSFTDFIYSTGVTFFIGALFLIIGIWLLSKKKDRLVGGNYSYGRSSGPFKRGLNYLDTRQQRRLEKEQARYQREQSERDARKERTDLKQQEMERRAAQRSALAKKTGIPQRIEKKRQIKKYAKARAEAEKENYRRDREAAERENRKRQK